MPNTRTHEPAVLPDPHAKVSTPSAPEAQWLVLEYLAADNDLEGELLADLAEMERVGSTPGVVEILAQVDRSPANDASKGNWHGTRRYYVTRGTDPRKVSSRILADLGPTNTGDPGVLESYIRFGALRYPARATALVCSTTARASTCRPTCNRMGERRMRLQRPGPDGVAGRRSSTRRASACGRPRPPIAASPTTTAQPTASTTRS